MSRQSILLILALLAVLIGSNVWWWYQCLDIGVTLKYSDQMLYERTHEVTALKATFLELSSSSTRNDVLEVLGRVDAESEPFEKHGLLIASWLSFRFDDNGHLVEVLTGDDVAQFVVNGGG